MTLSQMLFSLPFLLNSVSQILIDLAPCWGMGGDKAGLLKDLILPCPTTSKGPEGLGSVTAGKEHFSRCWEPVDIQLFI